MLAQTVPALQSGTGNGILHRTVNNHKTKSQPHIYWYVDLCPETVSTTESGKPCPWYVSKPAVLKVVEEYYESIISTPSENFHLCIFAI
jgi:hypothetical protein